MDRRDALRFIGAAATLPAAADLPGLGRRIHADLLAGRSGPSTLDPHQAATVTAVAELIIPATDTPGATAAGVTPFIDVLLGEWMTDDARDRFLAGLADLDARARAAFGKTFVAGVPADQIRLLTLLEDEALRAQNQPDQHAEPFFHFVKRLTMYGYYTSEVGAKQELHFEMLPGSYQGCAPLRPAAGAGNGGES